MGEIRSDRNEEYQKETNFFLKMLVSSDSIGYHIFKRYQNTLFLDMLILTDIKSDLIATHTVVKLHVAE